MEGHGFVKDVDHLHQRKAGGMVAPLRIGELLFDFLPISLGGRHRMIAVCDRKAGARQPRKGVQHVDGEVLGDEIPRKMPAVLHEIEVIELFELLPFERAHELVLLVPVKDHRVGELDERAPPYRHAGGQAGGNDLLRRTDERRGALLVGIFLEVDAGEKALADARVRRTFDKYEPARRLVHPALFERNTEEQKIEYLKTLMSKVYLSDIVERNHVQYPDEMDSIVDFLCSAIGSLTNPKKISDTLKSIKGKSISDVTAKNYLGYLTDAFLFDSAKRYDVKGKKYFETPLKYYMADVGLRNARLNFRQVEENHIMENVIFNELKVRGYSVDVGVVESKETIEGKRKLKQLEIDFVANKGSKKYYIQSAYEMPTEEKLRQEKRSLIKVGDSFKKIVVVKDNIRPQTDEEGIVTMGLINFLLDQNSLEL